MDKSLFNFLFLLLVFFALNVNVVIGADNEIIKPIYYDRSPYTDVTNGKFHLEKIPIGIFSVFASTTINITSTDKFHIRLGNSSDMIDEEALWWRALLKESLKHFVKKVSPFQDLYFKVTFDPPKEDRSCKIHLVYNMFDVRGVILFILGVLLFLNAKKLSRSIVFHYTSGASIGMLMSWMIILILLYRLLPYRRAMTTLVVTGTGAGIYFTEFMFNKGYDLIVKYPQETITVCGIFALVSMALMYYFGPPSSERSFNLIQWGLQFCAMYMIVVSSYTKEFYIATIGTLIILQFMSVYNVLVQIIVLISPRKFRAWYVPSPKERRLLTLEEYEEQGRVETAKALKELSAFCDSPDCNSWRVVSRLKDPKRFARFLNEKEHFTDEELLDYDRFEVTEEGDESTNVLDGTNLDDTDSAIDVANREGEEWLTDDDAHGSSFSLAPVE